MDFIKTKNLKKYNINNLIIWYNSVNNCLIYKYKDVIATTKMIINILKTYQLQSGSIIGIVMEHSPILISIIIGILNINAAFCPISINTNQENIIDSLHAVGCEYFFVNANDEILNNKNIKKCTELSELNSSIVLVKLINYSGTRHLIMNLCYCIQTSGTTGNPKIIFVPHQCILPNIIKLSELFALTQNDVLFISSPPTFDPFIVDIFMALLCGSAVLMVENSIRLSQNLLLDILFKKSKNTLNISSTTVMQMTPSFFRRWSTEDIQNTIFNPESSLRILVLGGEPFPKKKELLQWYNSESYKTKLKLFNIYGISEISCWATINEIKNYQEKISIGKPIDNDIVLEVRDSNGICIKNGTGQLFIGGRERKCIIKDQYNIEDIEILNDGLVKYCATGDIVEISQDKQIYYSSRTNSIIKRFGLKTNLQMIEDMANQLNFVKAACCLYESNINKLILKCVLSKPCHNNKVNKIKLFNYLNKNVKDHEIPDEIIFSKSLLLSLHGKVSKELNLHNLNVSKENNNIKQKFLTELIFLCCLNSIDKNIILTKSFRNLGGNSIKALQLITKLENTFNIKLPELIIILLNDEKIIMNAIDYIEGQITKKDISLVNIDDNMELETPKWKISVKWFYNLHKCIDATPTLMLVNRLKKGIISIGSHSKILVNLNMLSGKLISRIKLNDRIEGQVSKINDNYAVIGSYDGFLYCFNIFNGSIKWKFNSNGIIKSKPLILDNLCIFGNYNLEQNLWCINANDGSLKWSNLIGNKGIFSSPCQLNKNTICIGTLNGNFIKLNINSNKIIWEKVYSPIFSTPIIIKKKRLIILAEIIGIIHCLNYNGIEISNYKTNGNIFSSFSIDKSYKILFFGCYDNCIYFLKFLKNYKEIKLIKKFQLYAKIYSTPKLIKNNNYLIVFTIDGFIYLINIKKLLLYNLYKLNGEVFSSPVIHNNFIYIGCRDNNLYCLELSK